MRNTTVAMTCPLCGADHEVKVDFIEYINWQNGELIQNAMPSLTPTEREQLISRICPKCQEKFFDIDEDEDWNDEPGDIDSDMGYDPYAGCYTDDC